MEGLARGSDCEISPAYHTKRDCVGESILILHTNLAANLAVKDE